MKEEITEEETLSNEAGTEEKAPLLDDGKTEMTLGELMGSANSLGVLAQLNIPFNLSFRLSLFLKTLNPVIETGFERQNKLMAKHGGSLVSPEAIAERDKMYAEVVRLELPNISAAELSSGTTPLAMASADLVALSWLITE